MFTKLFKTRAKNYKKAFGTEEGKQVLNDLYKVCKINQPSYVENSPDKTAFNEGAKYVVHYIRGILKQSTEDVDKLLKEHKESFKRNNNTFKRSK